MDPKLRNIIFRIGLVILLLALCWLAFTSDRLTSVTYTVETDLEENISIVHLTDLHGRELGGDNQCIVEFVREQSPDLILMTGDMLDKTDENADVACRLIDQLKDVAPVYYSYGNHEMTWMKRTGVDLRPIITQAGATVLDIEYLDMEVKGQPIRLAGYYNYYRQPHMLAADPEQINLERDFCGDMKKTDRYIIFLNHIPTTWLDWEYVDTDSVDLVLCGHYHGGQVRLPFVGGLIAPYVGWFPEYTEGIYRGEKATCILSTGLGANPGIPRVNNPPQVVVVELVAGQ